MLGDSEGTCVSEDHIVPQQTKYVEYYTPA